MAAKKKTAKKKTSKRKPAKAKAAAKPASKPTTKVEATKAKSVTNGVMQYTMQCKVCDDEPVVAVAGDSMRKARFDKKGHARAIIKSELVKG